MIWQIGITLVLGLLGGLLNRLGGAAKTGQWYDFLCNTKSRDFGVPLCELGVVLVWSIVYFQWYYWIACFLSFGAAFGAMTTYWKKKGTDAKWYNWAITGLFYSLAFIPFVIASGDWLGFGIRTVVLTTAFTLWKTFQGNAVVSEFGAGVITVLSTILLAIGLRKKK